MMASGLLGQTNANAFVASPFSPPTSQTPPPYKMLKDLHFEEHKNFLNFFHKKRDQSFKKMAVSENGFLVALFVFLCLSLSSANRVLKNSDAENGIAGNDLPSDQDDQLHGFSHVGLKGGIPKFSSVGPTSGDCCNYGSNCGSNCGQNGYGCPPSYGCGGGGNSGCQSSGCQSCYSCQPCQWQGCQGCQGSPPPCGCQVRIDNNSKVQRESTVTSEPDPPTIVDVLPAQPENHNKKSSGGANQDMKSNGGLV